MPASSLSSHSRTGLHRARALAMPIALVMVLILAACGSGDDNAEPTATVPAASPTLAPGQVTVDSVLDRMDAAWPNVTSMVATSWSGQYDDPTAALTTGAPADQMVTVEKVVKPGSRSVSTSIGGVAVDDQMAINGIVYFRGQSVTNAIAPFMDATTWVEVNPALVPADSPVAQQLAYLTSPLTPPYGTVSEELRSRGATPTGQITLNGRTCDVFTFTDALNDGEGITYAISIDSAGLPCALTKAAGGYAEITTWTFNDPTTVITAPVGAIKITGTPSP